MPLYYFNVRAEDCATVDLVGQRCRDRLRVRSEAVALAGEIVRARLEREAIGFGGWIEVEDEEHRPVMVVPLRAAAC
jgi:hypothetical protein